MRFISRILLRFWNIIHVGRTRPIADVILHDPASRGAQDLDNPFIQPGAQARVGELIADQFRPKASDPATRA
jgi:hypothetical protein